MSPPGRRITVIWVRAALSVVLLLAAPRLFDRFERAMNPQRERAEYAQALERELRAGGEPVVLPTGEVRRAVVYPRASPSEAEDVRHRRTFTWFLRLFALVAVMQAMRDTIRAGRHARSGGEASPGRAC